MHLFLALDLDGNQKLLQAMTQTGFEVLTAEQFKGEDRFFCAVVKGLRENNMLWEKWRPRMIFSSTKEGIFSHLYTWQEVEQGMFLGTLYERQFSLPSDWYLDYGVSIDDKDAFYKVLADYSYRYLLEEIREETADWCGHMSSVVHKI